MKDIVQSDSKGKVNFEVSNHVLAGLLVNHLGKKRKLNYHLETNFVLSLSDLRQVYSLLVQKVGNDKNREVDFFVIDTFYDDGTSQDYHSFEELESARILKNAKPLAVYLTWIVIVDFESSETLEKQRLDLSFRINEESEQAGVFNLEIQHTNEIWANEIKNLVVGSISKVFTPPSAKVRNVLALKEFFLVLSALSFFLLFFSIFVGATPIKEAFIQSPNYSEEIDSRGIERFEKMDLKKTILNSRVASFDKLLLLNIVDSYYNSEMNEYLKKATKNNDILKAADKHVSYIGEAVSVIEELDSVKKNSEDTYVKVSLGVGIFFIFTLLLSVFVTFYSKYYKSYHSSKSFINLTLVSEKESDEYFKGKSKISFYGFSALIFSVLTGLLTTLIVGVINLRL